MTRNRFGQGSAGLRVWRTDVEYSTSLREDWDRFVYRTTDPRPPGQQYITLTPDVINSVYKARKTNYAAYGEQVFKFDHWDLRTGLRYDRDGFSNESLVSPRLAANWLLESGLRVSATAGVFYQSPRFLVRAASPANFGIKNERVTHASVGFEQSFGRNWSLLVEPYFQRLDRLVVEQERTSGRVTNDGEARISAWMSFCHGALRMAGPGVRSTRTTRHASMTTMDSGPMTPISTASTSSPSAATGRSTIAGKWARAGNGRADDPRTTSSSTVMCWGQDSRRATRRN
ncbi:MAG: TonB-dependent receptor [Aquincola sp.]|nr:TonB-dependent receptor [Aquincola sp.]